MISSKRILRASNPLYIGNFGTLRNQSCSQVYHGGVPKLLVYISIYLQVLAQLEIASCGMIEVSQTIDRTASHMATMQEQMQSAKAYIQRKQYADARRILKRVDHPKAKEWLAKIDELAPPPNINAPAKLFLAWGQMALAAFLAWIVAGILDSLDIVKHFVEPGNMQQNDNVIIFVWVISFAGFFYLLVIYTKRWKDKYLKPKVS